MMFAARPERRLPHQDPVTMKWAEQPRRSHVKNAPGPNQAPNTCDFMDGVRRRGAATVVPWTRRPGRRPAGPEARSVPRVSGGVLTSAGSCRRAGLGNGRNDHGRGLGDLRRRGEPAQAEPDGFVRLVRCEAHGEKDV